MYSYWFFLNFVKSLPRHVKFEIIWLVQASDVLENVVINIYMYKLITTYFTRFISFPLGYI